jgi:hypothetical protein
MQKTGGAGSKSGSDCHGLRLKQLAGAKFSRARAMSRAVCLGRASMSYFDAD